MKTRLVALVAAAITLAAGSVAAQKSTIIQKIIVKVNGEIFTQTELEFRQIQAIRDQNRQMPQAADLTTNPAIRTALAEVTPTILVDAVDELMLVQHAREVNLTFTDAIFSKWVEESKKENKLDDQAFLAALKQEGLTMADLRVKIERDWLVQNIQQKELMRNMTLTEEEARQYFNAHQNEFMKPATVTLREIFIAVPSETINGQVSFSVSADEATKRKIAEIRDRATKGEDYVKLVAEVSESPTKANGGLIGPVISTDLNPAVSALLDKMKPGDITEPLRTKTGYQLIKLETRSAAEVEAFDKSREQISRHILEGRLEVEKAKFLEKLRAQAVIEWKDDAYKKMYDAAREARAKGGSPAPAGR